MAPDDAQMRKLLAARQLFDLFPFCAALSMRLDQIGDGRAVVSMPWNAALVGNADHGTMHGGALTALLDSCCGAAILGHPQAPQSVVTLNLRLDHLRPARSGSDVVATAEVMRMTPTHVFMRAELRDDDPGVVTMATGVFAIEMAGAQG